MRDLQKKLDQERDLKSKAFNQLEGMRLEIKAIEVSGQGSAQDGAAELWKQKCKELFDICKELQKENDEIKAAKTVTVMTKVDTARGSAAAYPVDTQILDEAQHYYSMAPVSR